MVKLAKYPQPVECMSDYAGPKFNRTEIENNPNHPFWRTVGGRLHRKAQEEFNRSLAVPNEWLPDDMVDGRSSDTHTLVDMNPVETVEVAPIQKDRQKGDYVRELMARPDFHLLLNEQE